MCGDVDVCMKKQEHLHFVFNENRFNECISRARKQKRVKVIFAPDSNDFDFFVACKLY